MFQGNFLCRKPHINFDTALLLKSKWLIKLKLKGINKLDNNNLWFIFL